MSEVDYHYYHLKLSTGILISNRKQSKSAKYHTQTLELTEGESAMSRAAQNKALLMDAGKPEETKAMVKTAPPQANPEPMPFTKEMLSVMFILDMVSSLRSFIVLGKKELAVLKRT